MQLLEFRICVLYCVIMLLYLECPKLFSRTDTGQSENIWWIESTSCKDYLFVGEYILYLGAEADTCGYYR